MRVKPVATVTAVLLLVTTMPAETVSTAYQFLGGQSGGVPVNIGSLAVDGAGNLYGTIQQGGKYGRGGIFQLSGTGKEIKETLLFSFRGSDGASPLGAVVLDESAENIYGTTLSGGKNCSGGRVSRGTVFRLSKSGTRWTQTFSHSFCGTDGAVPYAGVILDPNASHGNDQVNSPGKKGCCYMYGTTRSGGIKDSGVVFGLSKSGAYRVIYSFCPTGSNCVDGKSPKGGLIVDKSGNLYGTTVTGGSSARCGMVGCGTVFKISKSKSGSEWRETVLYSFKGGSDGANPQYASLTFGADGTIFGVTAAGGDSSNCGASGCGTVFQLAGSKRIPIYSFQGIRSGDGAKPEGTLVMDSAGNLYGTTAVGGSTTCSHLGGCGIVFKLVFTNGSWTEGFRHSFTGHGGGYPESGLVFNRSTGNLYGVTAYTGQLCDSTQLPLYRCGVVYAVEP
jgi:hypothetical protein